MFSFAAILAGGRNARIGRPKAFLEAGGAPFIERTLEILRERFETVAISTNDPEDYFRLGAPLVGDVYTAEGPMSGIFSALSWSGAEEAFITACDMPFIRPELVDLMIARYLELKLEKGGKADALAPVWNGKPEPLLSFYSSGCMAAMEPRIISGRTGLAAFLKDMNADFLDEAAVRKADPAGASFFNVNTPEDLEMARTLRAAG